VGNGKVRVKTEQFVKSNGENGGVEKQGGGTKLGSSQQEKI